MKAFLGESSFTAGKILRSTKGSSSSVLNGNRQIIQRRCLIMWRRLNWIVGLFTVLLLIHGVAAVPGVVGRAEAQVKGQQSLEQLIDGAKKEGRLKIAGVAGGGSAGGVAIGEAFNKRFGVNINFESNTE